MKQVLGIIGSLRRESIHRQIFNHYKDISEDYFSLVEGSIADIPLYNEDLEKEPSSVIELSKQIQSSDAVIFFSPEYNYSIPGVLKNALDWVSRNDLKPFDNKLAAIIGASPGSIGTSRMQYHLRQVGVFLNIQFLNKPEVMIGSAFNKLENGRISDAATVEFLKKHANVLLQKMSE